MVLFSLKLWEDTFLTLNMMLAVLSRKKNTKIKLVQGSQNKT